MPGASLYLVGFMASGKSTIGAGLAAELAVPLIDVDAWIEAEAGQSVAGIWKDEGEAGFRRREAAVLRRVAGRPAVIATGGGAPVAAANRELLLATGLVLWLKVRFELIWERGRAAGGAWRPLWRDRRSLRALLAAREPLYGFAHVTIDVADEEPSVIVSRLAAVAREWKGRR